MQSATTRLFLLVLPAVLAAAQADAANRCVDGKGRITFQDIPCPDTVSASEVNARAALGAASSQSSKPTAHSSVQVASGYTTAKGEWRGPAQFQFFVDGVREPDAQAVTPLVIELKPSGEVVGVMTDSGCSLSGLSTQFVAPYAANIDVTFKGCTDKRFNVRFNGFLTVNSTAREAKLSLNAIGRDVPLAKFRQASIDAVLKR